MTERVTIHDVARAAGVSTTTVSSALTGKGRIAASTRERIHEVARNLGYTANPTARSLRSRTVGAIGLYFPGQTFGLEYYMDLSIGAASEALDHGLALTLIPATADGAAIPPLHVDGVVVSDPAVGDPMLARLAEKGLPVVTCERDLTAGVEHAGRVESDHDRATRELLDHLADRGAERIAILCPGDETSFGYDIRRAYQAWCRETGREVVVHDVPFATRPEEVRRAVERALAVTPAPDALVSVPDGGASSTLQEVLREGRRVPEDLLVASYVDSSSLRGLPIPITAVDIAPREMGRRAARLLAGIIAGELPTGTVDVLPTKLAVRTSTSHRSRSGGSS